MVAANEVFTTSNSPVLSAKTLHQPPTSLVEFLECQSYAWIAGGNRRILPIGCNESGQWCRLLCWNRWTWSIHRENLQSGWSQGMPKGEGHGLAGCHKVRQNATITRNKKKAKAASMIFFIASISESESCWFMVSVRFLPKQQTAFNSYYDIASFSNFYYMSNKIWLIFSSSLICLL